MTGNNIVEKLQASIKVWNPRVDSRGGRLEAAIGVYQCVGFEARAGPGRIQSVEVSVSFLYLDIQLRNIFNTMETDLILNLQMTKTMMLILTLNMLKSSAV